MKFLKSKNNFNWKYIIGEILLIFIGINLAIWFNNWNTAKKTNYAIAIAIVKVKGEIENNIEELTVARKINQSVPNAFSDYQKIFNGNSSEIISTPHHLSGLKKKYPDLYRIIDSVAVKNDLFQYKGGVFIELEIPELTEIAWETTKSIDLTHEFNYDCLYDLESMYNLQHRVQNEIDKAANALQKREIKNLMNILGFLKQLDLQLLEKYENMLESIDNCS